MELIAPLPIGRTPTAPVSLFLVRFFGLLLLAVSLASGRLDAATEFHDVDGNGVNEAVDVSSTMIRITSPSTGTSGSYAVGPWTSREYAELDGKTGDEILLVNRTSGSTAKTWIISFASNELKSYEGQFPNGMRLEDLDGKPGLEVIFVSVSTFNGSPNPGKVRILTDRTRSAVTYDVGRPRALQYLELDGKPGTEILFTNVHTLNGIPSSAQATVVTHATGEVRTYEVGKPRASQVVELDGKPGTELLFTNVHTFNGTPSSAQATVITHAVREAKTYEVGSPNSMKFVQMKDDTSQQLLFTNLRITSGVAAPAKATLLDHKMRTVTTHDVGSPNTMQLAQLNGTPGDEVLFTNLRIISGTPSAAKATVLGYQPMPYKFFDHPDVRAAAFGSAMPVTTTYDLGRPGNMQFANLDGNPGDEVLFTNLSIFNGSPNAAQATILTHGSGEVKTYEVGRPSFMQFKDLDGHGEDQLVFTNLKTYNGSPLAAQATVVTHRTRSVRTYEVGKPRFLRFAELDGFPGNEMLFTDIYIFNGTPQQSTATVVGDRARFMKTYNVGKPTTSTIAEVNGRPGNEVVFTSITGNFIISFRDDLTSSGGPIHLPVIWRRFFFENADDPLVAGNAADPDRDGYSNLMERAFGGDPTVAGVIGPTTSMIKGTDGRDRLTFRFRRPIGGEGITYRLELSSDMKTWDTSGTMAQQLGEPEPTGDGITEWISLQAKTPVSTVGRLYGRIKISE